MSSPRPQTLLVHPTPRDGPSSSSARIVFSNDHEDAAAPVTRVSLSGSPPSASSLAFRLDRTPPPAPTTSIGPSITEHHVWSVGTSKRRTKSALRASALSGSRQLAFEDPVAPPLMGGLTSPASGGPSPLLVDQQQLHYGVAGYRSDGGSVGFYRTSVHKKDPQNIIMSHGVVSRVVDLRAAAAAAAGGVPPPSSSSMNANNNIRVGRGRAVSLTTSNEYGSEVGGRMRWSGGGGFGSDGTTDDRRMPYAQAMAINDEAAATMSADGMERSSLPASLTDGGPPMSLSMTQRPTSISPNRPRWNGSARVAAAATTGSKQGQAPMTTSASSALEGGGPSRQRAASAGGGGGGGGGGGSRASVNTHNLHRVNSMTSDGSTSAVAAGGGVSPPPVVRAYVSVSNHSGPPSLGGGGGVGPSPPRRGITSWRTGSTHNASSSDAPPAATRHHLSHSSSSLQQHDCRDAHCIHSRADIMEIIAAKSQVRAMESQLLHEEIRREQLASALSSERERNQQLSYALNKSEQSAMQVSQAVNADVEHWRLQSERNEREKQSLQSQFEALQQELKSEKDARLSERREAAERQQSLEVQLRSTVEELQRAQDELMRQQQQQQQQQLRSYSPVVFLNNGNQHHQQQQQQQQQKSSTTAPQEDRYNNNSGTASTRDRTQQIEALESEVAQLREERQSDERLRRELLRALSDKERQLASFVAAGNNNNVQQQHQQQMFASSSMSTMGNSSAAVSLRAIASGRSTPVTAPAESAASPAPDVAAAMDRRRGSGGNSHALLPPTERFLIVHPPSALSPVHAAASVATFTSELNTTLVSSPDASSHDEPPQQQHQLRTTVVDRLFPSTQQEEQQHRY